MKAILVDSTKENHPLIWTNMEDPVPKEDEVLLEVHATSLNRADLLQRAGHYPPPTGASPILGLDVSGKIIALGERVRTWQVGERVCALVSGGGYAELCAVPAALLLPIPKTMSYEEAAAIPEVFLTAFTNIFLEANFKPGERVLIHGGASGVGTAAIQLVREAGGKIFVTASTTAKLDYCRRLGSRLTINYKEEDFVSSVLAETDGKGVDIIMDMVGGKYLARNIQVLAVKGRLVFIATLGGGKAELDIRNLMSKRLRLIGSVLRSRTLDEKVVITKKFSDRFWGMFAEGRLKAVIDSIYPITQANAAHARMAAYENIGKIVLSVRT